MTAAHIDSDRMTEETGNPVAAWSEAEAGHLLVCADCRFEFEMLATARQLGAAQLTGFQPERVAAGVRRRLRDQPVAGPGRSLRHPGRWLAGLAAAAALVLAVRLSIPRGPSGPDEAAVGAPATESILHELDGLSAPQLEDVLQSIPPATEALGHVEGAPLGELSATDLERMLRSMEE